MKVNGGSEVLHSHVEPSYMHNYQKLIGEESVQWCTVCLILVTLFQSCYCPIYSWISESKIHQQRIHTKQNSHFSLPVIFVPERVFMLTKSEQNTFCIISLIIINLQQAYLVPKTVSSWKSMWAIEREEEMW